jgi:hypothetical protein
MIMAWAIVSICLAGSGQLAHGGAPPPFLLFETELLSLNLTPGPGVVFPLPLASDPGNTLGDSIEGYGLVNSHVAITLSSQRLISPGPPPTFGPRSLGEACASLGGPAEAAGIAQTQCFGDSPTIDPDELHDQLFRVQSFFDVFFDVTVTDVDPRPGRNFAGQGEGESLLLPDNEGNLQTFY